MKIYLVYKITREDNQSYIGMTYDSGLRSRIYAHKKSSRFKGYKYEIEILEENPDFEYICDREEYFITLYNTYNNGLNETPDGKGLQDYRYFTTKGYKFSEESKKKMSIKAKQRLERDGNPFKGKHHTEQTKEKLRQKRLGKIYTHKLSEEEVKEIIKLFNLKEEFEQVGKPGRNGKIITYERAFALKYCKQFNVTKENIERIIRGSSWKHLER